MQIPCRGLNNIPKKDVLEVSLLLPGPEKKSSHNEVENRGITKSKPKAYRYCWGDSEKQPNFLCMF